MAPSAMPGTPSSLATLSTPGEGGGVSVWVFGGVRSGCWECWEGRGGGGRGGRVVMVVGDGGDGGGG